MKKFALLLALPPLVAILLLALLYRSQSTAYNQLLEPSMNATITTCVRTFAPACPVAYRPADVMMQMFENGIMIRFADYPRIYVFYTEDMMMNYYEVAHYESHYFPPETPPEGFYSPEGSFEHIWSNSLGLRHSLGWATGPQVDYSTTIESYLGSLSPHDDRSYLRLPDNRVISFDVLSSSWSFADPAP